MRDCRTTVETVKHARVGRPQWREDPLSEEGTDGEIEQLAFPGLGRV
jgi:hypothetical protein